ncbi:MAG: sigma 54-interacting transcriptional regulator [Coriobacteriia bacterium]|nr:sigma 54-interacting transcriptional regulator [Coriobacteriia bacterium]
MTPESIPETDTCASPADELSALLQVSQTMVSSFDIDRNLRKAMRVLAESLDLQRGTVALVHPETRELRIAAAHGLTRAEIARGIYRVGEGVVGRVVSSGKAMVVPNIGEEPLFLNRTGSRPAKTDIAFISVPIVLRGEVLGVLSADRVFGDAAVSLDEDVRVLEIVASNIAHAVRLYWTYQHEVEKRESLRRELRGRYSMPNIIGDSDSMQEVFRVVTKVAMSQATVLLRGESGTGKELIAHALHYQGMRPKGPFIAINCAALPENLLEAELFGYEKGAFTGAVASKQGRFELARGGTIFLDEVGDVSPGLQAKLLRVLQERTFERLGGTKTLTTDARIVSATNRDLEHMTKQGEFREDLYWRLNVVPVFLPPLRDRREDLPLLIEHFLGRFGQLAEREVGVSSETLRLLLRYPWPGNIRELENTIQRLVVLADNDLLEPGDLPMHLLVHDLPEEGGGAGMSLEDEVEALERRRIVAALRKHAYVQAKAARELGVTPRQLGYKIRKYDLEAS